MSGATVEALGRVPFLAGVPEEEIAAIAGRGEEARYEAGERIIGELEPRDTLVIVLAGRVRVSVACGESKEMVLAEVGASTPLGEIGLLTGRVATATATAVERTTVLHVPREEVSELMVRHPCIARSFAKLLAARIIATDQALDQALRPEAEGAPALPVAMRAEVVRRHGVGKLLVAAMREGLYAHRAELPFFFLSGFVAALVVARIAIVAARLEGPGLRNLYVLGLGLLLATGGAAHFVFHRRARVLLCALFGMALGFLANELSVLLAFDVFYVDMTHRDPTVAISYADLYDRAPTRYALLLVAAVALQATYLRGFYRHALFIVRERLRRRR